MMKPLATQFENKSLGVTVVTPTCCSCCCCFGTAVGSSAIAAHRVSYDGKINGVSNAKVLTGIAALWWVIVYAVGFIVATVAYATTRTCETRTFGNGQKYESCTDPSVGLASVFGIAVFFGLLYFVFSRAGTPNPAGRTAKFGFVTLAVFIGEFIVGAILVVLSWFTGGITAILYLGGAIWGAIAIGRRYRKRLNASLITPATPLAATVEATPPPPPLPPATPPPAPSPPPAPARPSAARPPATPPPPATGPTVAPTPRMEPMPGGPFAPPGSDGS